MGINPELLAPCGLYCGVCGIRIAHLEKNEKFKERLSTVYHVPVEELVCEGCLSEVVFKFCRVCPIKSCTQQRGFQGCHQCAEFPCRHINNFPMPVGKKVMLRALPQWRELGSEKWVAAEEQRYHCPACGYPLFRGAKRCRNCKAAVDQD